MTAYETVRRKDNMSEFFFTITINGESKLERTGTPEPRRNRRKRSGPQNVNIRTGTVVPGPQ